MANVAPTGGHNCKMSNGRGNANSSSTFISSCASTLLHKLRKWRKPYCVAFHFCPAFTVYVV